MLVLPDLTIGAPEGVWAVMPSRSSPSGSCSSLWCPMLPLVLNLPLGDGKESA